MLFNCGVGEDSWESFGLQGDPTSPFWRRLALGFLWKEWCLSWNSSTLATSCKELTHWKRLWCWEGLGARGEGDDRGWDGWMASLTRWTWVWVNSRSWWWTGRPGVLRFMGLQRVGHDWATELNWTHSCLLAWFMSPSCSGLWWNVSWCRCPLWPHPLQGRDSFAVSTQDLLHIGTAFLAAPTPLCCMVGHPSSLQAEAPEGWRMHFISGPPQPPSTSHSLIQREFQSQRWVHSYVGKRYTDPS